ncbi:uncharacterized protein DS421_15g511300 [Arachis hypogaea]|nr:uncharacterized protein DS421_15g511300 [Arachis hypogaea]
MCHGKITCCVVGHRNIFSTTNMKYLLNSILSDSVAIGQPYTKSRSSVVVHLLNLFLMATCTGFLSSRDGNGSPTTCPCVSPK